MANKRLKEKMKRRRNGEGSVSERKDGYFQASLMARGERGYDLDDFEVQYNSWKDIIMPQSSLHYIYLNSGSRDSAIPLADMLIASLRNYRKRNHDIPLDLYI